MLDRVLFARAALLFQNQLFAMHLPRARRLRGSAVIGPGKRPRQQTAAFQMQRVAAPRWRKRVVGRPKDLQSSLVFFMGMNPRLCQRCMFRRRHRGLLLENLTTTVPAQTVRCAGVFISVVGPGSEDGLIQRGPGRSQLSLLQLVLSRITK